MRLAKTIYLASAAFASLLMLSKLVHTATSVDTSRGDQMIAEYFRAETQKLADASLADVKTWEDWTSRRDVYRQQLREMLGLEPLPEHTPLQAVVTGTLERDDFKVEKLYFQSRPHLYVTANLYLPKKQIGRVPAILYVCGHSASKEDGISFGGKTKYQHHGAWFARNGYVCLVVDTLQLGEIEGIHHGTYREKMWWWNARGYTPAGVEAWNSIRAVDYLVSRPEVDPKRIGMTGRSGGGAYSWYTAALDDRIKAVVPVAGITNLRNHVVDDCVEDHCDCMYFVNTYRWDYPQLAALIAPRPLLISNTDRDAHFPLDGVVDLYQKVRHIYELSGNGEKVALQIAAGRHEDLQVLQLHALSWFNQHLKGDNPLIETAAKNFFKPQELKVFDKLPTDQINTRIQEMFVTQATVPSAPVSKADWQLQRGAWMTALREKCFRGWPAESQEQGRQSTAQVVKVSRVPGASVTEYEFVSQDKIVLPLYLVEPAGVKRSELTKIILQPLDPHSWSEFTIDNQVVTDADGDRNDRSRKQDREQAAWPNTRDLGHTALAFVAPRGIGSTQWSAESRKQTHIRRRFMLLGQTLNGMQVWDVRRAIQTLRTIDGLTGVPLSLKAEREMAGISLYAALFEPKIAALDLRNLSKSHREGPDFLNVLRFLDVPQTVAMVEENSRVVIHQDNTAGWEYPVIVAKNLGWNDQIEIRPALVDARPTKSVSVR